MRQLYGAARRAIGGTVIVGLCAGVSPHGRLQELPGVGRTEGERAAADPVDAYLLGTWHLSQAIGRMACRAGVVTPQLRAVTGRDLDWAQRGLDAQVSCSVANRFAAGRPVRITGTRVEDVRRELAAVRADYDRLATSGACWTTEDGIRVRAMAAPVAALSDAAAGTLCAIASWHQPLPATAQQTIGREIDRAGEAAARIGAPDVRRALLFEIRQLRTDLTTATGEQVFQSLSAAVARLRQILRSSR
jgi:hypothetical protein